MSFHRHLLSTQLQLFVPYLLSSPHTPKPPINMSEDNAAASSGVPPETAAAVAAAVEETKKEEEEPTTKDETKDKDGASEAKVEPSTGRAKRERKTVKAFNPEEFVEEKKEIEVPDGAGIKIVDMRKYFNV